VIAPLRMPLRPDLYLGFSNTGHDGALAIVSPSGELVFAEAVERPTQTKIAWGIRPDRHELLANARRLFPHARAASIATSWLNPLELKGSENYGPFIRPQKAAWIETRQHQCFGDYATAVSYELDLDEPPVGRQYDHHLCHAAYACSASPFKRATALVVDGEGEEGAISVFQYENGQIRRRWRSLSRASIGGFYTWLTNACGFEFLKGEEWKVMGLAACGTPRDDWTQLMDGLIKLTRGRPALAADCVERVQQLEAIVDTLAPYQRADFAASGQAAFTGWMLQLIDALDFDKDKPRNLVFCGGCAHNSSFNGHLEARQIVDAIFVPSAPGDDGNAIGAALLAWMEDHPGEPLPKADDWSLRAPYYGTHVRDAGLKSLDRHHIPGRVSELGPEGTDKVASLLADGKIIGVMRGRAEFGPRALGNRSILADPRDPDMKDRINALVKRREAFRPFAPAILFERTADWFESDEYSPFMARTRRWKPNAEDKVPAVVHDDHTGRLQTVTRNNHPWLHDLLQAFEARTGVPIILNTSLNVMGKPIVHSVADALAVFASSGLDALVIDDLLIEKT
jgi:carbamoyltransferase